jgi:hypothetical protein
MRYFRVKQLQPFYGLLYLGFALIFGCIKHLPLQVADGYRVMLHNPDPANAHSGEVLQYRYAETAGAYHQHLRLLQQRLFLPAKTFQPYLTVISIHAYSFTP